MTAVQQPTTGTAMVPAPPVQVVETSTSAAISAAKATVEARFLVAQHRPRDWARTERVILAACTRPRFAESARYKKPAGEGKFIEGPSIRFAEVAMRAMGNLFPEATVVFNDPEQRIIRVAVTDLEANLTISVDVVVEKTVERRAPRKGDDVLGSRVNSVGAMTYLIKSSEDQLANKQNAAVSKTLRNAMIRLLPDDLVAEAMEAVRDTLAGEAKKAGTGKGSAVLTRLVSTFANFGVSEADLAGYLNHPVAGLTPEEFAHLRGIGTAIENGETTWQQVIAGIPKTNERVNPSPLARDADEFRDQHVGRAEHVERLAKAETIHMEDKPQPGPLAPDPYHTTGQAEREPGEEEEDS